MSKDFDAVGSETGDVVGGAQGTANEVKRTLSEESVKLEDQQLEEAGKVAGSGKGTADEWVELTDDDPTTTLPVAEEPTIPLDEYVELVEEDSGYESPISASNSPEYLTFDNDFFDPQHTQGIAKLRELVIDGEIEHRDLYEFQKINGNFGLRLYTDADGFVWLCNDNIITEHVDIRVKGLQVTKDLKVYPADQMVRVRQGSGYVLMNPYKLTADNILRDSVEEVEEVQPTLNLSIYLVSMLVTACVGFLFYVSGFNINASDMVKHAIFGVLCAVTAGVSVGTTRTWWFAPLWFPVAPLALISLSTGF